MNEMKDIMSKKNNSILIRVAVLLALIILMFSCSLIEVDAASLKAQRVSSPTIQTQKSFGVKGLITASKKISKATVGVVDQNGKWVISKQRTIKAKSFKLSTFDKYLKFKKVGPGTYYYRCVVYYSSGGSARAFNKPFTVYSYNTSNVNVPATLYNGEGLSCSGSFTFLPYMNKMECGIATDSGRISGHYYTVNFENKTSTFDLSRLDKKYINVTGLKPGKYYFYANAVVNGYTVKNVVRRAFVIDKNAKIETTSLTTPKELTPGKAFGVHGVVKSSAKLSSVQLGVIDSKGKWVISQTAKPNSNSYDLNRLDKKMVFSKLSTGSYNYRCIVVAGGNTQTVFDNKFYVMSSSKSGITYPSVLFKGNSFSIVGKVTSKPSMTNLTVGVTKDGNWLKGYYVTNKSAISTFDIGKSANSKISFGKLPVGVYTYRCTAQILGSTKTFFDYKFEVTDKAVISLSNVLYPPKELYAGKSFSIGGKVTSNVDMSKVRIGITDNSGNWKIYKDYSPKSKSFNIADADRYITFGSLPVGSYYYRVDVSIGGKTYTKVQHAYNVIRTNSAVSTSVVDSRIEQLLENLDGKYFTTDGKKAKSNIDSRCNVDNVLAKNTTVRNLIKKYKGGYAPTSNSLLPQHYALDYGTTLTRGYSCCGFANFAEWYIFANSCSSDVSTVTIEKKIACNYSNAKKVLKKGDIIRIVGSWSSGHSAIVLSVNSSGIELLDCNTTYYNSSDKKASRICSYRLGYSKIDYMSVSRATNSPYL